MAEPMIPAGAFAAMKSGAPMPSATPKAAEAPKAAPVAKAPEQKAEPKAEPKVDEAPKDMTAAEKKIWKLKAEGEEFEFDATDEENVKRAVMKVKGSEKRLEAAEKEKREAEASRRQAEEFIDGLRDPARLRQILEDPRIGVDLKKFAEDLVWEQIQEEKMSPEERVLRDKDMELKRYKDKEAKEADEKKKTAAAETQKRFEKGYEEKIQKTLAAGNIPQTHEAVQTMAHYLYVAAEQNIDLSPEDLVEQVRASMKTNASMALGTLKGQALLDFIGEAGLEEIRKTDLARLKDPQGNPFPSRSAHKQAANGREQPAPKKVSGSVWKDDLIKDFLSRK